MSLAFYIAHSTPGRTRIRWAGDTSEKSAVAQIAADIAELQGIQTAVPRITTGSIIIEHDALEWTALQPQLSDKLSLQFTSAPPAVTRNGAAAFNQSVDGIDRALNKVNTDFDSVALILFIGIAIVQALRGQVMSSSASFLWYAYTIAEMSRSKADRMTPDTPEPAD